MQRLIIVSFAGVAALAACATDNPTALRSLSSADASASRSTSVSDPTATWKLPINTTGLSFKSDGQYSDGTYSSYANGVCNVSATIFATTAGSNSGDATISTGTAKGGKCLRTFVLSYPDGFSETVRSFNNLNELENTTYAIPIGATVARRLVLNPGQLQSGTRCGKLVFGASATGAGTGSDSVMVTRVDGTTWHVQSQASPSQYAYCGNTGQLFEMPVNFVVVASRALP